MKAQWISLICAMLLLASCGPRSAVSSGPPASIPEESSAPSSSRESLPSEPSSAPEPESQQEEAEPEPEFPAPILTDTEKEMLAANVSLYAQYVGPVEAANAEALSKDAVLAAVLAEIERTKDFNAYLFEQDGEGNDKISINIVADLAMRLFGLSEFTHTENAAYDSEQECYLAKPVELAEAVMSEIAGAPDDNVAYTVSFPEGDFLYTGKILRQNGMPYLRFLSSEKL